jgi:endonuclease/exonuclease/phosphatase family metal-dependent hydrolase
MPISTLPDYGAMPADVAQELAVLSAALDEAVPSKQLDRNLLVASWNIREFGGVNPKWDTASGDSPKRNVGDLHHIAEILSRFDVIAVQEALDNLDALREVMKCLGPEWGFHVTDVTAGKAGDSERLAYLYDLRRVRPSGLAGELVLSPQDLGGVRAGAAGGPLVPGLTQQLVKTPYIMSFSTSGRPFVLATVHIFFGEKHTLPERAREVEALTKMLHRAVKQPRRGKPDDFRANLIALGDFNVTKADDVVYKAMTDNGLQPDVGTLDAPRTLKDRRAGGREDIAYDQMAWFKRGEPGGLTFDRVDGGTFTWDAYILTGATGDTSFRISDHYPLWIEFAIR